MNLKWVIGDIRGDLHLFKKLMDKIGPTSSDTVIFLGSYLGPGKDSKGCVQYALDLKKKAPESFLFLRGCYEFMFGRCIGIGEKSGKKPPIDVLNLWSKMQGNKVFESYSMVKTASIRLVGGGVEEIPMQIPADHLELFDGGLSHWYEDETLPFIATHAGYHPSTHGDKQEELTAFTANDWWKNDLASIPGKQVIFSHVPFKKPFLSKSKIGIDLGCGLGGKLCAFEAYSQTFTEVS